MFRSRVPHLALVAVCATGLLMSGCDPKRVVGDGQTTGTGNNETFQVQPEARALTAILALHMEIIRASLSQSAAYDSGPGAPVGRGLSAPSCVQINAYSADPVAYDIHFDGCIDHNGTELRGGGTTYPLDGVDGYYFFPYANVEDMIIASNASDQSYNHTYESGTLEFAFQRAAGAVNGVVITKYLRHQRGAELVQISYAGLPWNGTHGDWNGWPASGATANGAWDGVSGPFEVEFSGQSTVFFTLNGIPYVADLASGDVAVNQ